MSTDVFYKTKDMLYRVDTVRSDGDTSAGSCGGFLPLKIPASRYQQV